MEDNIFQQKYKIRSININSNKRLGLYGLLGILQDAASEHAFKLDFGYEAMIENGSFWVLIRQKLKMTVWPKWHDSITIKTWTAPIEGFYDIREFEIYIENEKIGECSTTWMILDSKTRRPKEISEAENTFQPRTDYRLGITADKIYMPEELKPNKTFEVQVSDLDMNNHVNNVQYSQWLLNSIPFKYHKSHIIDEFEINFLNETFIGDVITCSSLVNQDNLNEIYFSGTNEKTAKTAFYARLVTKLIEE